MLFDPLKKQESLDTIIPELAEKWSWQEGGKSLAFSLRKDVKWHDGQPFTSKDVKFTFDTVREAADAPAKLRINPRKEWYANVDAVEAPDPYTVVFRLKRPQPSLVAMLASGYSPVIPAHVPIAEHRARCIGTGPFKFKEWKRGQSVELVRNPDYFVKGRPYLDGVRYTVIVERGTRVAALQANQIDIPYPGETTLSIMEQLKGAVPGMVFSETASNVSENLLLNTKKAPFDNVKVRRALSFAIDRRTYTQTVHRGLAVVGASLAPKPWGAWGLLRKDPAQLPGYGGAAAGRASATKLLAEPGEARGRRGPADHGLADRPLRALPVREEPDPEPGHLQRLPAPGRLARQVARHACGSSSGTSGRGAASAPPPSRARSARGRRTRSHSPSSAAPRRAGSWPATWPGSRSPTSGRPRIPPC